MYYHDQSANKYIIMFQLYGIISPDNLVSILTLKI